MFHNRSLRLEMPIYLYVVTTSCWFRKLLPCWRSVLVFVPQRQSDEFNLVCGLISWCLGSLHISFFAIRFCACFGFVGLWMCICLYAFGFIRLDYCLVCFTTFVIVVVIPSKGWSSGWWVRYMSPQFIYFFLFNFYFLLKKCCGLWIC